MKKSKLRSQATDLTERERAAFGPRTLKKRGSAEWCWQTLNMLAHEYEHIEEQYREVRETIGELAEVKAWEVVPPGRPYGSLDAMLRAEIGIGEKEAISEIEKRAAKAKALDAAAPDLKPVGRPKQTENVGSENSVTNIKHHSNLNDASYAIRRLRKDRPDIHARVLGGEISAHAGMIEAKFRKKRPSKRKTPLEKILTLLLKLTPSELHHLIARIDQKLKEKEAA